jgi:glucose-6-phosphate 1-dehydrogenase
MESPVTLRAEDVRDEKVKVLKAIAPIRVQDCVMGQYDGSADGKLPSYREDPTVSDKSNQVTFFQTVVNINNRRWAGVPFICKCGKGLDSKNTEVRIQFKNDGLHLFPTAAFNELVFRLQPDEAIWLKVNTKKPGFSRFDVSKPYELDLTYKQRFGEVKLPEAYTRLILDSLRGDQSLFVRDDELRESWRIVTPLLHHLERENHDPPKYARGSRGPAQADEQAEKFGFRRIQGYVWSPLPSPVNSASSLF